MGCGNVLPIFDMGKVIKLLIEILTGDDSWVEAPKLLTIVGVKARIINSTIGNPLLSRRAGSICNTTVSSADAIEETPFSH